MNTAFVRPFRATVTGIALTACLLAASASRADVILDSFDTDESVAAWSGTWGTSPTFAFDAENQSGAQGSGSLAVTGDYFTPDDNGWEQMVVTRSFPSVVGAHFKAIAIDVKVDPSSAPLADGSYGYFELKRTDGSTFGGLNLTATSWTTVQFDIPPTEGDLAGIIIQTGSSAFQGPVTLKLDNLRLLGTPPPITVLEAFDTEDAATFWSATWGTSPILAFSTENNGGIANSGSLEVMADYFTPDDNGWEQMVVTRTFETPVAGADFVSISIDVKVASSSTASADGNFGYFELKRTDGSAIGGVNLTGNEWTTLTFNLPPTEGELTGIIIQNGSSTFQGPVTLYLDNLVLTGRSQDVVPPTLAITRNTQPGLRLIASAPGQAYQRQNIVYLPSESLDNALWWVNQGQPVTYAVTWAEFPDASLAGFQGHLFLAVDSAKSSSPDWTDANVMFLEFQYVNTAGPDGQTGTPDDVVLAQARLLHKVNEPNNNAMLYRDPANATETNPAGVLGNLQAPSMLGTWSITFVNNTQITLTAPNGATADLVLPDSEVPAFEPLANGVSALFGVQPNAESRVNQAAVISRIRITKGAQTVVDESFQSPLNEEVWAVRAQDPGGVFPTPASVAYLVSWNLPDAGFTLRASPSLAGPWSATPDPRLVGARRVTVVESSAVPGPAAGFFQLVR